MTKTERDELAKLVRRRERLAKADADRVAAERLADFEAQLAAQYSFDQDDVWREARGAAAQAAEEANARIMGRCAELGIPERFAPGVHTGWYDRGENTVAQRRTELRAVAKARVAADVKAAKVEIERRSVEVQTQLVAGGLQSTEGRKFMASMPTAETLMPTLSVAEIEADAASHHQRRSSW